MDEIKVKEDEIKEILNKNFLICCPYCHSSEYEFYPTSQNPFDETDPINDIWYICKVCSTKWPSDFMKNNLKDNPNGKD